jgi:hypothetical protein
MSATTTTATEDALLTALLHAAKFPSCAVGGALLGPPGGGTGTGGATRVTAAVPLFHHPTAGMAACVEAGLAQVEALAASRGLALLGYYHAPVHYDAPGPRAAAAGVDELPPCSSGAADGGGDQGGGDAPREDGDDAARLRSLPPPVRRIAERIAERRAGAVVLALNNPRLARFSGAVGGGGGGGGAAAGEAAAAAGAGEGGKASADEPPCPFDVYAAPGWQRVGAAADAALRLDGDASSSSSWAGLQRRFLNATRARLHRALVDFDEHLDDVSRDYTNPGLLGEATRTLVR